VSTTEARTQTALDRVTFEVVRSTLVNLVSEMGIRLTRIAFSPVIVSGRDFSLAILAPRGDLVTCGPLDLPAHVGTLEHTVHRVLDRFPLAEVRPGDVFLLNDPHDGGTHNNDLRVVLPVFVEGEVFVWMAACGHWADIGGSEPGSFNAMATSCFAEGLRIPAVRLYSEGVRNDELVHLILGNVRLPKQSTGDLQAMLHAVWDGERRLHDVVAKYGVETVRATLGEMLDYSERLLQAELGALTPGVYECEDWCDLDKPDPEQRPFKVHLRLEVREDGRLVFDYRGSDPQPLGPTGSGIAMTWSATVVGTLNMFPKVPFNHGVARHMEVVTTPGTCVHVEFPGAISGTAAGVYEKVVQCVLSCIGQADPERLAAQPYNLTNMTVGGEDADGRAWVMYFWLTGGYGATRRGDAYLPSMMLYSSGSQNQPVEVLERAAPIIFEKHGLKPDSMGPGRFRGGPGVEAIYRVTSGKAVLNAIGDRNKFPPWGVEGGGHGLNQDIVVDAGGPAARSVTVNASGEPLALGERVHAWTGGGGGLGDPLERDPERVVEDVVLGILSLEAARRDYGVVIEALEPELFRYAIDEPATRELREQRRADGAGG
jgi:N-methylhydantoinase B